LQKFPPVTVLELELESGWLTIWFNQPKIRNPLTDAMRSELLAVLLAVSNDRSIRGITLRGRGGFFCAGGDLKAFRQLADGESDRQSTTIMSKDIGVLLDTVNSMPQVVLAFIEGAAMAGGFGLACCADVVVCSASAKFAMTETSIGLSPAQIAPYTIQKLGYATARRLMLTAARFDGRGALEHGFADLLGDTIAEMEEHERVIRAQVAGCAPGAIADTKALILELKDAGRSQLIDIAAENFTRRVESEEALEGINSFFEKRKPSWADQASGITGIGDD